VPLDIDPSKNRTMTARPVTINLNLIAIELDLDYGELRAMQNHPDVGWLKKHGYSEALASQLYLDEEKNKVVAGAVSGNILTLTLKAPTTATKFTCLKESAWSQDKLIRGTNGIAALTFCDVPLSK